MTTGYCLDNFRVAFDVLEFRSEVRLPFVDGHRANAFEAETDFCQRPGLVEADDIDETA